MTESKIVCICGSHRFYKQAFYHETIESLKGHAVFGFLGESWKKLTDKQQEGLRKLHRRKIELSDEILFVNINGYVGDEGRHQLAVAFASKKPIRFVDEQLGNAYLETFAHEIAKLISQYTLGIN